MNKDQVRAMVFGDAPRVSMRLDTLWRGKQFHVSRSAKSLDEFGAESMRAMAAELEQGMAAVGADLSELKAPPPINDQDWLPGPTRTAFDEVFA